MKPTIVFDLDDVFFDFKGLLKKWADKEFNIILNDNNFKNYCRLIGSSIDLNTLLNLMKTCGAIWNVGIKIDGINFRPFLKSLHYRGYRIVFSTARSMWGDKDKIYKNTKKQLKESCLYHDKLVISEVGCKLKGISNVKAYIDDYQENLLPYVNRKNLKLYLISQPWNTIFNHDGIKKIKSLTEILGDL